MKHETWEGVEGLEYAAECGEMSTDRCPFRVAILQPGGIYMASLEKWKANQVPGVKGLVTMQNNGDGSFSAVYDYYRPGINKITATMTVTHLTEHFIPLLRRLGMANPELMCPPGGSLLRRSGAGGR